ncbi:MAG: hypothetical protein WC878_03520 [Candidatus Paceibacterota bacterium]|jgi:hypothetical protein
MNTNKDKKISHSREILDKVKTLPLFTFEAIKSNATAGKYSNVVLHRLVKSGDLLSLKRGIYVSREYLDTLEKNGGKKDYLEFLVSALYSPSYVSSEYVLAERGILSEASYSFTGITKNKTARISNELGNFNYHHVKDKLFTGFDIVEKGTFRIFKATTPKALYDFLYIRKNILNDKSAVLELRLNVELLSEKEKNELSAFAEKEVSKKMKKIIGDLF